VHALDELFRIKEIHLRRAAAHEEEDNAFRFWQHAGDACLEWIRGCAGDIVQGKGAEFVTEMAARQVQTKFAPMYHAFAAAMEGEDYLLRINPETRQASMRIHEGLDRRLRLYPK